MATLIRSAVALILVWATCGSALAAIAGQPKPADVKSIESCLDNARNANSAPSACVGVIATPCQASALNPKAKEKCADDENVVWSDLSLQDFTRLELLLTSDVKKQLLRETQTNYERSKGSLCTFDRILRGNSPEGLLAASQCRLDASARYDLWLRAQIELLTKN